MPRVIAVADPRVARHNGAHAGRRLRGAGGGGRRATFMPSWAAAPAPWLLKGVVDKGDAEVSTVGNSSM